MNNDEKSRLFEKLVIEAIPTQKTHYSYIEFMGDTVGLDCSLTSRQLRILADILDEVNNA